MGALLFKSVAFAYRSWELKKKLTFDRELNPIRVSLMNNKIIKVVNYKPDWTDNRISNPKRVFYDVSAVTLGKKILPIKHYNNIRNIITSNTLNTLNSLNEKSLKEIITTKKEFIKIANKILIINSQRKFGKKNFCQILDSIKDNNDIFVTKANYNFSENLYFLNKNKEIIKTTPVIEEKLFKTNSVIIALILFS